MSPGDEPVAVREMSLWHPEDLYIQYISHVGNNCLESSTKFLGIYIDECLTWRYHAAHINSKNFQSNICHKTTNIYRTSVDIENTLLCINPTSYFIWNTCMGKCWFEKSYIKPYNFKNMPSVPSTKLHIIATPTLYLTNHKF